MSHVITPREAGTMTFYKKHAREFCESTSPLDMQKVYTPFLKELPKGARILDAGCGCGRDSLGFMHRGFRVTAIDASPEMVREAQRRGLDAQVLAFQDVEFSSEFDGIWACASLLHVPHSEIHDVLRRLHRALRPHGTIYFSLKEGTGERVAEDGRFFSYFTLPEFTEFLERTKFRVLNAWPSIDKESSGAMRNWLNFLACKER